MGEISKKLKRFPGETAEFDHNGQIKEFLVELGLSSQFRANATGPVGEETMIQSVTEVNYGTHFIVAVLWTGYDDPEQNGYHLWAIAKSKCNLRQFSKIHQSILKSTGGRISGIEPFLGQQAFPSN